MRRAEITEPINDFIKEQVQNGKEILNTVFHWNRTRKADKYGVESRSSLLNNRNKWHARISYHNDVTYEQFKNGLFSDHTEQESKYIKGIKDFDLVEYLNPNAQVYRILYSMPLGISDRDFTPVIVTHEEPSSKSFYVISIAIDHPNSPPSANVVRGLYTSIERVQEVDDGKVEWIMATMSSAKGLIPNVLADTLMPSKIAEVSILENFYKLQNRLMYVINRMYHNSWIILRAISNYFSCLILLSLLFNLYIVDIFCFVFYFNFF